MGKNTRLCYGCMKEIMSNDGICPFCNFNEVKYMQERKPFALAPGQRVNHNRFIIGKTLGIGGFGITYLGYDVKLQRTVAIKEYFPATLSSRNVTLDTHETCQVHKIDNTGSYEKGLKQFLDEARTIIKFDQLPGVVRVIDYFEDNNTVYMVMEYLSGKSLKQMVKERCEFSGIPFSQQQVLEYMKPIIHALKEIHASNVIHRDISPDNMVMNEQGILTLVDFGSARNSVKSRQHFTIQLKPGFAPLEQYSSCGNQGPWTDVYSLCGTIYYMMTNAVPQNATERLVEDKVHSLYNLGMDVSKEFSNAIAKGMSLRNEDRYQSMEELEKALYSLPMDSEMTMAFGDPSLTRTIPMNYETEREIEKERPSKKKGPGKGLGIVMATILGVLVIGLIIYAAKKLRPDDKPGEATTAMVEATTAEATTVVPEATTAEATTEVPEVTTAEATTEVPEATTVEATTEVIIEQPTFDYSNNGGKAFYGIWTFSSKALYEAIEFAEEFDADGIQGSVFLTSEWENLNQDDWYAVSIGVYDSRKEAEKFLSIVKNKYPTAYIKYTGDYQN